MFALKYAVLSDRKKNTVTQIWMLHLINNIYADSRRTHHFKRQLTNVTCIEWIKWHTSKWNLIVPNVMTKFDNFSLTYLLAYLDWGVRMTHLPHSTPVDISTAKMPNTASGTIFFFQLRKIQPKLQLVTWNVEMVCIFV